LGNRLRLNTPIVGIRHQPTGWRIVTRDGELGEFDSLILALPGNALAKLHLPNQMRTLCEALAKQPHASVACVALGFPSAAIQHPLNGFGLLIPKKENRRLLGVLFPSSLFPNRAPAGHTLLHCFIGGTRHPQDAHLSDNELIALAMHDLQALLGMTSPSPTFVHVRRWLEAIPQYTMQQAAVLEAVAQTEAAFSPSLRLIGPWHGGIGVPDRIRAGFQAADSI
jgi:oxygen-dependent protoporphyrinogen oxidase